jgi:hypothetical protein
MASSIDLVPARVLDWNALAQRITLAIIDALKVDVTFMNAMTTREQCCQADLILRIKNSLAIPYVGRGSRT